MAISYVGGTTGSDVSTNATYSVPLTGLTGGSDSAPIAGDLVIVTSGWVSTTNGDPGVTTAGYTETVDLYGNDTRDANLSVAYKFMGGTPDTSVTVTNGTGTAQRGAVAVIQVFRGVDQTTPLDVATTSLAATNSSRPNPVSITPVTPGAWIVVGGLGTGDGSMTAMTVAPGMSNAISVISDGSSLSALAGMANAVWTSGAYNPELWTGGETTTSDSWAAATLALRPAISALSTLTDNFSSGSSPDAAKWTNWGGANVTIASQQLNINSGTAASSYYGMDSVVNYDLTGSYGLIQVADAGTQAAVYGLYPIQLQLDATNSVYWYISNNSAQCWKAVAGAYAQVGSSRTHTNGDWYRIRESGGTIHYEYSTDGISWSSQTTLANPFAVTSLLVSIFTELTSLTTARTAILDNFNVAPVGSTVRQKLVFTGRAVNRASFF